MAQPVFKSYSQGQAVLFPASLDEKLPADSPARLVNEIVDNLDISRVIDTYKGGGSSAISKRALACRRARRHDAGGRIGDGAVEGDIGGHVAGRACDA